MLSDKTIADISNMLASHDGAGRPLTSGETALLRRIFGDEVPYDKVRIAKGGWITKWSDAVTIDNKISFKDEVYQDDFAATTADDGDRALLAHELTHVWQYNKKELVYTWMRAVNEHLLYRDRVYDYTPVAGKKLTDYRFEQQGKIVQDYCTLLLGIHDPQIPPKDVLESIIYSVIRRPA